jgi:hypothetical protein
VLILDVDDAEADYLLAVVDPLAAMATADAGALDALLSSVQSGEAAVQAMLAELAGENGQLEGAKQRGYGMGYGLAASYYGRERRTKDTASYPEAHHAL